MSTPGARTGRLQEAEPGAARGPIAQLDGSRIPDPGSRIPDPGSRRLPCKYVDRPPLRSHTAPVEKEFSSDESQATSDASSETSRNRPRGIFDSMNATWASVIWSRMRVRAAVGVTQFTAMFSPASSLPSDLVNAITPAFEAL